MQISGSKGTPPETKMSASGTSPAEVAFRLAHIVFKTFSFVLFHGEERLSQNKRDLRAVTTKCDVCATLLSATTKPTLVLRALNMVLRKLLMFRCDNGIHTSYTTKCLRFTLKYISKKKTKVRGDK